MAEAINDTIIDIKWPVLLTWRVISWLLMKPVQCVKWPVTDINDVKVMIVMYIFIFFPIFTMCGLTQY
jgi:hypothetical protein